MKSLQALVESKHVVEKQIDDKYQNLLQQELQSQQFALDVEAKAEELFESLKYGASIFL